MNPAPALLVLLAGCGGVRFVPFAAGTHFTSDDSQAVSVGVSAVPEEVPADGTFRRARDRERAEIARNEQEADWSAAAADPADEDEGAGEPAALAGVDPESYSDDELYTAWADWFVSDGWTPPAGYEPALPLGRPTLEPGAATESFAPEEDAANDEIHIGPWTISISAFLLIVGGLLEVVRRRRRAE